MLNSFRVDFSGQTKPIIELISGLGNIVQHHGSLHNQANKDLQQTSVDQRLIIKDIKHSICKLEGSTILPQDYTRDHQITKHLPPFTQTPTLLLRLSDSKDLSNRQFHALCDDQGPLLLLVSTKQAIFGGYAAQDWRTVGGYRKCKESYLFRLSEPLRFMSKVANKETKQQRALYFSKNYGMVFGQGDLNINFDDISKSSSKLGQTFQMAPGRQNMET